MESRIQLKPVLGGVRIVALSIVLMNRLNKTESAVFLYCRFSLFLRDPFFHNLECVSIAYCVTKFKTVFQSLIFWHLLFLLSMAPNKNTCQISLAPRP